MKGLNALFEAAQASPTPLPVATSVFWAHHGTRLAGGDVTYLNRYVLVRVGPAFGACAFEEGELDPSVCAEASGLPLGELLAEDRPLPLRLAALDALLAAELPHHRDPRAEAVSLPEGTPERRAVARDAAIAGLLPDPRGRRVGLIGVVNPLVAAIRERGGECLPCDLNLRRTQWGDEVGSSMEEVLDEADAIVATGMTLGNGTFDTILERCRERDIPLVVYAQSGAAVARALLGEGVTALSAEPFPFSQFSAVPTALYRYRSDGVGAGS
ncbi:Rossmann-like domain-containing protein [Nocardiopsis lambiniae]|uniref:DUF364 domain-containing protein n=1 Tax=Nocardiopsis lambiniae TaxID=3075539 RepID=A0ABU2M6Q1_9ACTN|nr:DUF364 domain-containing protein [Nocardiopsis sp. DSM 44743]MDT0328349.1 DUF364 domain-containing protein [Nocardiopsis sp. DSM 44743]